VHARRQGWQGLARRFQSTSRRVSGQRRMHAGLRYCVARRIMPSTRLCGVWTVDPTKGLILKSA
jgi:hypothetical protein